MMVHCSIKTMLHRIMKISAALHLALDDLIADLQHARRNGDLGRLALVAYCDVRPWARKAGQPELAELLSDMMTGSPHTTRSAFLDHIDQLIFELLRIYRELGIDESDDSQPPRRLDDDLASGCPEPAAAAVSRISGI